MRCLGCGLTQGHSVSDGLVCEYATERSILFDTDTGKRTDWPDDDDEDQS